MKHVLPLLPYDLAALQPVVSAETLALHYGKHHRAYVDKLNEALKDFPHYQELTLTELLRSVDTLEPRIRSDIRKHGGGHANHSLLWETMVPGGHPASATLTKIVEHDFHSFDGLQRAMSLALDAVFGSGWVFLSVDIATGALQVLPLPYQDSPLLTGSYPLLAFDAWEHAYYLQYHQDRSQWFKAWWTIIDWQVVEREYVLGMSGVLT